ISSIRMPSSHTIPSCAALSIRPRGVLREISKPALRYPNHGPSGLSSREVKIAVPKVPGILQTPKPVKIVTRNAPFPAPAVKSDDCNLSAGFVADHHHGLYVIVGPWDRMPQWISRTRRMDRLYQIVSPETP